MLKPISLDELLGLAMLGAKKEFYTLCVINGHAVLEATMLKDDKLHMWEQGESGYAPWVHSKDNVINALKSMTTNPEKCISSYATQFKGFYTL